MKLQNDEQSNFKRFLKENKTLVFTAPILVILIVIVIIVYSNPGGGKPVNSNAVSASAMTAQANSIDLLPQSERTSDTPKGTSSSLPSGSQVLKDPFRSPLALKGVVISSDENSMAIIEGNGKSYIVKKGDVIEGNITVESITEKETLLKQDGKEISLQLKDRGNSQTINNQTGINQTVGSQSNSNQTDSNQVSLNQANN